MFPTGFAYPLNATLLFTNTEHVVDPHACTFPTDFHQGCFAIPPKKQFILNIYKETGSAIYDDQLGRNLLDEGCSIIYGN